MHLNKTYRDLDLTASPCRLKRAKLLAVVDVHKVNGIPTGRLTVSTISSGCDRRQHTAAKLKVVHTESPDNADHNYTVSG